MESNDDDDDKCDKSNKDYHTDDNKNYEIIAVVSYPHFT